VHLTRYPEVKPYGAVWCMSLSSLDMQGECTARVMVAILITMQLVVISFTMATGGMRVEESRLFIFGKRSNSCPHPKPLLERITINGESVHEVWTRFRTAGEDSVSLLTWFETSGANIVFHSSDVKSHRAKEGCKDVQHNTAEVCS
jgi:hypothetical protein